MTAAQRQRCQTVRNSYLSSMSAIMTERQALNAQMQVWKLQGRDVSQAFACALTAALDSCTVVMQKNHLRCGVC